MVSILGRAGLRPVLIGLAALAVGISVEWPKRHKNWVEPDALAYTGSTSGSPTRSPIGSYALASLAPSLPAPAPRVARDAAHGKDARPASFAKRFTAGWFQGEDEDEDAARPQPAALPMADEDLDEASGPSDGQVYDLSRTAVYVIAEHLVYMPDGTRMEAHSGLGARADNPRYITAKGHGPTPPNIYKLVMRERPFHGVRALRLIPQDGSRMFGRNGILAHRYMRGGKAQSAGCVVFRNYPAFLAAFERGVVNRIIVVERIEDAPDRPNNEVRHANLSHHAKRKRVASR
jgi:Protein of unknown function (DUF2778)